MRGNRIYRLHLRETACLSLAKGATIKIFIFHTFVCKNESNFAGKFRDIFNSSPHSKSICRSSNLTKLKSSLVICSLKLIKYFESLLRDVVNFPVHHTLLFRVSSIFPGRVRD